MYVCMYVCLHMYSFGCVCRYVYMYLLLPIPTFFRVEHEKPFFLVFAINLVILEKLGFHFLDP